MSDPVASKSTFLCMYMSNHPDTLVGYVKYWGNVQESVASAQMTYIDTKGMTLSYQTSASGGTKKEVRVEFDPPLAGYEEVKPRLLSMKVDAEEALGMARAPQVTTFRVPLMILVPIMLMGSLCYVTWAPEPSSPSHSDLYYPGYAIRSALPSWAVAASWCFMVPTHALEALYAFTLCRKHRTPFGVGLFYVLGSLFFGFPILGELRHQAQAARIESIMKGK